MAIVKEVTINVSGNKSSISKPVYLYLGDGDCTLLIAINESDTRIGTLGASNNLIEEFETVWARVCLIKPDGRLIKNDTTEIIDNKLLFTITKSFIDEFEEAGEYKMQIHLYDEYKEGANRFTIPPVAFNILTPLCDFGHDIYGRSIALASISHVDSSVVDNSIEIETFLEDRSYNRSEWVTGDLISAEKLNKIEDGIWWNTYYDNMYADTYSDLENVCLEFLPEGKVIYVKDEDKHYYYNGNEWAQFIGNYTTKEYVASEVNSSKDSIMSEVNDKFEEVYSDIEDLDAASNTYVDNKTQEVRNSIMTEVNNKFEEVYSDIEDLDAASNTYVDNKVAFIYNQILVKLNEFEGSLTNLESSISVLTTKDNELIERIEALEERGSSGAVQEYRPNYAKLTYNKPDAEVFDPSTFNDEYYLYLISNDNEYWTTATETAVAGDTRVVLISPINGYTPDKIPAFENQSITTADLTNLDCSSLQQINFSSNSLKLVDLSNANFSRLESIHFSDCIELTSINFSNTTFTNNISSLYTVFYNCLSLTTLDLSMFVTDNVDSISYMFNGCSSLTSLNLSGWRLDHLDSSKNYGMFSGCKKLETVYLRNSNAGTVNVILKNISTREVQSSKCTVYISIPESELDQTILESFKSYGNTIVTE